MPDTGIRESTQKEQNMPKHNILKASISAACLICVAFLFGCTNDGVETASGTSGSNAGATVAHAPEFTTANFQSKVLESSQVVLVDCWAAW